MTLDLKPWTHASPSQIERFRRCNRKWWWKYVAGIPEPLNPAAELGKKMHEVAEAYLRGENDKIKALDQQAVRIFLPGRPFLPKPPVDPDDVEQWIGSPGACEPWDDNPDGYALTTPVVPLVGRVDLFEQDAQGVVTITDHKTTSSEGFGKTEEQLKRNVQAIVYSRALFEALPEELVTYFRHVYYLTKGPARSWDVRVAMHRQEVDKRFGAIVDTLADMANNQKLTHAADVPHNPTACGDYGGCPYRSRCAQVAGGGPMGILKRAKQQVKGGDSAEAKPKTKRGGLKGMSIQDRLARAKGAVAPEPGPEEEPKPARKLPDADEVVERVKKGLRKVSNTADRDPAPPNPPDGTPRDVIGDVGEDARKNLAFELNGETIRVKSAKKEELCEFLEIDKALWPKQRVKKLKALAEAKLLGPGEAPPDDGDDETDPDDDDEVPEKLAKKTNDELLKEVIDGYTPEEKQDEHIQELATKASALIKQIEEASGIKIPGHVLFVDSMPFNWPGDVLSANDVISELAQALEDRDGIAYYAADKFRERAKELAGLVAEAHKEGQLVKNGDAVMIDTRHPLAAELCDILERGAAFVVRGLR